MTWIKTTWVAAWAATAMTTAAGAATMTMVADKSVYAFGETITITVTADSEGDSFDVISLTLEHDTSLVSGLGVVGPETYDYPTRGLVPAPDVFTQFDGGLEANRGGNEGTCGGFLGANRCNAWDEFFGQSAPVDPGPEVAVLQYIAGSQIGTAIFGIRTDGGGGSFYFGGTPNPGDVGLQPISVEIVPEPGTAALLAVGLVGLARRRRGHR